MALKLYDKIVPSGEFALIDAANVEMPDGRRLTEVEFGGGSGGISTSAARLLITILSSATFVNDQSANIQRLNELLLAGTDEPEIPDEPDFTSSELGIAVLGEMILGGDDQENDSEDSGDNTTADDGESAVLGVALLGKMIIGAGG